MHSSGAGRGVQSPGLQGQPPPLQRAGWGLSLPARGFGGGLLLEAPLLSYSSLQSPFLDELASSKALGVGHCLQITQSISSFRHAYELEFLSVEAR